MKNGIASRLERLERSLQNKDAIYVIWRRPDGDIREAVQAANLLKGQKAFCAEWFNDGPLPEPSVYGRKVPPRIPAPADICIVRSIERKVRLSEEQRLAAGFSPFPTMTHDQMKAMTDVELIQAILGVTS